MIVVGLGNIGQKYSGTRHNVGFDCIDIISRIYNVKLKKAYDGEFAVIEVPSYNKEKLFLFKPGKYMNNSGDPVQKVVHYWKIQIENVIVIHDDLDIKCGTIRIKKGGGSGGHNGIKSIDSHLGNDYWRIRVGIGKEKLISASDFVLRSFTKEEKVLIDRALAILATNIENIKSIVASEIARAELINRVNNAEYGII
ncbi:aminoacyl-tRNA hydrolase [Candidatus Fokinia crypta]|uniref:Peptidyl-tRNA hydrolase n=1 Tax=Candidatus Fokinia crypta TaxID=1920990 RepID=A0ABZ0UPL5_9RICK|nr:aminoacyl-tRNA hydrolase [Candidatus Fokinia cryptica]WPX98078.1 Peptidyl-tRNA hydrolase [Candidatus Fokinia cryptica]